MTSNFAHRTVFLGGIELLLSIILKPLNLGAAVNNVKPLNLGDAVNNVKPLNLGNAVNKLKQLLNLGHAVNKLKATES